MRKGLSMVVIVLAIAVSLPAARAQDADKKFEVNGDLRIRYDRLDNYFDFDNGADDLFSFFPYRARVGVTGQLQDNVEVVLQIQNIGSAGNQSPVQGLTFPPFQQFDGDGTTAGGRRGETSLYQGKVILNKVAGEDLSITLGRQEFSFGNGLIIGNEEFYAGNVFDGAKGVWTQGPWNLTGFFFKVAERQDPANGSFPNFGSVDANMYGLVWDLNLPKSLPGTLEAYVIRYSDSDEASFRLNFFTFGGHWWRTVRTKADVSDLPFDWNAELAVQRGNAHDPATDAALHLKDGYICSDSFGWNFASGGAIHRVFGAYLRQSGDDDVPDNTIKGWIPLFPTTHGLFGNADFFDSNFGQNEASIQALSLGYNLNVDEGKHMFGARIWKFQPVEDRVLFVAGGTKDKIKDFGKELDLTYDFMYSKQVTLSAGFAVLKPADGLTGGGLAADDKVERAWGQVNVKF